MAQTVSFDFKNAKAMATDADIAAIKDQVVAAKATLVNKTGEGNDFLGWIDLPVDYDKEEFARIKKAAAKIQADSDVLVVIGIGGSYLGARAAIEALRTAFIIRLTSLSARHLRFIMQEAISAVHTWLICFR